MIKNTRRRRNFAELVQNVAYKFLFDFFAHIIFQGVQNKLEEKINIPTVIRLSRTFNL